MRDGLVSLLLFLVSYHCASWTIGSFYKRFQMVEMDEQSERVGPTFLSRPQGVSRSALCIVTTKLGQARNI